jgi:hypothetical protein
MGSNTRKGWFRPTKFVQNPKIDTSIACNQNMHSLDFFAIPEHLYTLNTSTTGNTTVNHQYGWMKGSILWPDCKKQEQFSAWPLPKGAKNSQ